MKSPQAKWKPNREAYVARTYKQYNVRVRYDSDLYVKIEKYLNEKKSLNALVIDLLREHFDAGAAAD